MQKPTSVIEQTSGVYGGQTHSKQLLTYTEKNAITSYYSKTMAYEAKG